MSFIPSLYGTEDPNNSSTTPILANATFAGTGTNVLNYASLSVYIATDQPSASQGLKVQFSSNGTNWDVTRSYGIVVPVPGVTIGQHINFDVEGKYYRIVYINGGTNQGVLRLQSILNAQVASVMALVGAVSGNAVRYPQEVKVSEQGSLLVRNEEPASAYGDPRFIQPIPISQFDFVYGLNTNYITTASTGGGTVTSSTGTNVASVTTNTGATGASAILQSRGYFKYRDGQGGLARYTTIYTSPGLPNTQQIAGVGDMLNAPYDGYFFGYNGTDFGILWLRNGVETWITQANWNGDTLLGTGGATNPSGMLLNPAFGNIYKINTAYLGFGNIKFYVYNPSRGAFVMVHNLRYANSYAQTIILNPTMVLTWRVRNIGTASGSVTIGAGSGALFIDGPITPNLGAKYGRTSVKTIGTTTETNMITIQNNTTINSITNKTQILFTSLIFSTGNGSNAVMTVNLWLNPTVGGTPAFTNVDSVNSIAAYDVAGTTVTGGTLIQSYSSAYGSSLTINLASNNVLINPGDRLVFTCLLSTATGNPVSTVSVNWYELT